MQQAIIWNKSVALLFSITVLCSFSFICLADNATPSAASREHEPSATKPPTQVRANGSSTEIQEMTITIDGLRVAIKNRDYQSAYQSALAIRRDLEGEPEFDFLFGLSALEVGEFQEAVFALERVVTYFPNQLRARLELGRAYFASHNYVAAEKEFNLVLGKNPPNNVRKNVVPFLERIELMEHAYRGKLLGYIGISTGYDTNTNSATDDKFIEIESAAGSGLPIELPLTDDSRELDDTFASVTLGLDYRHPMSKRSGFSIKIHGNHRNNVESDTYDLSNYVIHGSYYFGSNGNTFSSSLRYQNVNLNDEAYQKAWHLGAQWSRAFSRYWGLATDIVVSDITYPDAAERDLYQLILASTINRKSAGLNHSLGLAYSNSNTKESDEESYGKNTLTLSYTLLKPLSDRSAIHTSFHGLITEYDARSTTIFTSELREDDQIGIALGWRWIAFKGFAIQTDVSHTINNSNIDFYEYDRSKLELGCQYRF